MAKALAHDDDTLTDAIDPATGQPPAVSVTVQIPAYAHGLFEPHRYKVLYGGRARGASWSIARALLVKAMERPLRIFCAREFQLSLRDSAMQLLRDQIEMLNLPGFRAYESEIRHANGTRFVFDGLRHNLNKIKSFEGVDICWIEEAERITAESWRVLIPTIRKPGSEIWVSFNPDRADDATYKRLIVNPPADSFIAFATYEQNPWLSDETRKEIAYDYKNDPESAAHVWGGGLRTISKAQVLAGKWCVEPFDPEYEDWNGPYYGLDFGFSGDPLGAVELWVGENTLYVRREVWGLNIELDHITKRICDVFTPEVLRHVVRADSARPDSISYLKRHGMARIVGATKGAGSIEDGIAHLRSYERIVIHPECPRFRDEAERYSYKVDPRSDNILPTLVDAHNHLIDAARYALEPLMQKQRQHRLLFVQGDGARTCPRCESYLPDMGACVHCGYDDVVNASLSGVAPLNGTLGSGAAATHTPDHGRMKTLNMRGLNS